MHHGTPADVRRTGGEASDKSGFGRDIRGLAEAEALGIDPFLLIEEQVQR
jgi:hypothetical protein